MFGLGNVRVKGCSDQEVYTTVSRRHNRPKTEEVLCLTNDHVGHCLSQLVESCRTTTIEDAPQLLQVSVGEAREENLAAIKEKAGSLCFLQVQGLHSLQSKVN